MKIRPGTMLNQYSIVEKIGEGGMGAVYSAEDTTLRRRVALKVLPDDLANDRDWLRRFEREARVAASLNHPNVVTLYGVDICNDTRFLVMELVVGRSLSDVIPQAGLPLDQFFRLALPLVEAIAAAHSKVITHRDLKPANVMVSQDGSVKVLDFGLAKEAPLAAMSGDSDSGQITEFATGHGQIVGTVAYMSPEQTRGKPVDARSDVFSLGVTLYEMITGRQPFVGDSPVSVMSAILLTDAKPVRDYRTGLPNQLQRILDGCLAKDPSGPPPISRTPLEAR